jgi:hypothetical protein
MCAFQAEGGVARAGLSQAFQADGPNQTTVRAGARGIEGNYSLLLPAFFALAHLALANADSLALAAADIFRFGFRRALPACFALIFAHRALVAATILAMPAALIFRFLGALVAG